MPNRSLRAIAAVRGSARWQDAQTALMRRVTAFFLPGVFVLLGASLAQFGRVGRFFAWWRLLALGTLGYTTVVSVKSFWSLGEFGVLSPVAATTWPLLFALGLSVFLQLRMNGLPWDHRYLKPASRR